MFGGAGNDQFFIARNNTVGGARDTIDGGTGSDELIITVSTYQMTDTFKAELLRLNNFTILHGGDSAAHSSRTSCMSTCLAWRLPGCAWTA